MYRFSTRPTCTPHIALLALVLGFSATFPALAGETGYWAKGRILVETRAGLGDGEFNKILSRHGGRFATRMKKINVHVIKLPDGADERVAAELLKLNPHIKSAEVDKLIAPEQVGNDTYYKNAWHLPKIQAPIAWDSSLGANITIAILDSGVDGAHPDLTGKLVPGWNFYDGNSNTSDVYGHGTKVAGSAAAASNNGVGVTGVAWKAKIMPVRISDTAGYAFYSTIAEGIYWAADNGAKVVNISYSVQGSTSVQNAANYLRSKGGIVVNSAGNSGALDTTLANNALISVSATGSTDTKASWSSFGDYVDVAAPGAGIWTTTRGGGYASVSGTSFSSPVTAGVIALMMSANPALKPSELESILKSTAVDLGAAGSDREFGAGRVNAAAAVQRALALGGAPTTDTSAPLVSITSPGSGSVTGVVPVNVSATDNVGITKVELYAKGVLVATDPTPQYSFSWDSKTVADGAANLVAKAYDSAGNVSASTTLNVTVANGTPGATTGDTVKPKLIAMNLKQGTVISPKSQTVTVSASDNVGVARIKVYLGGTPITFTGSSLSYSWNTSALAAGWHRVSIYAYDAANNYAYTYFDVKK